MSASTTTSSFGGSAPRRPPSADGHKAGTLLALAVHAGLLTALAVGVSWRSHQVTPLSAELWAAVPRIAAPEPTPAPPPPKAPVEAPRPTPPKPAEPEAQITTEKKPERPRPVEPPPEDKAAARAEAEKRRQAEERQRQQQLQERIERQRQENLRRLASQLAGSAPSPSPGTAEQDAGPSASYAGRVRARILPNIVFTDAVPGRAVAEVLVEVAPDGQITGRRLGKSSGIPAWDEAVLRAIDRTEQLPLDEGRAPPSSMVIEFDAKER